MASNPWMKSVVLINANEAYRLWDLMQAVDSSLANISSTVSKLQIQLDPAAGAGVLYVGNEDVNTSPGNYGAKLYGSQAFGIETTDVNCIDLKNIWILCDVNPSQIVGIATLRH